MLEGTNARERAKMSERSIVFERADEHDRTNELERAGESESATKSERAEHLERTMAAPRERRAKERYGEPMIFPVGLTRGGEEEARRRPRPPTGPRGMLSEFDSGHWKRATDYESTNCVERAESSKRTICGERVIKA